MPVELSARIALLEKIHLFYGLRDSELIAIAKVLDEQEYPSGSVIFEQNAKAENFYLIYNGTVKISRDLEGKEFTLATLIRYDYFGEMSLVSNNRRYDSATALNNTTLLVLPRREFEKLYERGQYIRWYIESVIQSRRLAHHVRIDWLRPGEIVYFITRKHYGWIIQNSTAPILLSFISILLIAWFIMMHFWFAVALSIILLFAVISWETWKVIDWVNSYFVLTNERIVSLKKVVGVYASRQDVLLNAILSIDTEIEPTGKILDYGNVIVRTSVGKMEFSHLANLTPIEHLIEEYWFRSKQVSESNIPKHAQLKQTGGQMDGFELITQLKQQLSELPYQDSTKLDALRRRADMIIRNLFGPTSKYLEDLRQISFHPMVIPSSEILDRRSWKSGREELENLFNTMEEELRLFQNTSKQENESTRVPSGNRIFIVHGHDDEMKQHIARVITQLGLDPIILHEKPNQGRTIIEKFSDYSEVAFAVVLLSPDDLARKRNDAPDEVKSRARQNVVLELGYFLGKLGRNRVVALYREESNFEMPSDYSGVLFVPFDSAGRWQFDLARELKAVGFNIDVNKLI